MLWFYLSGLAILVGAELNAEIEHASPYGKEPGEKVPGEKKKIGRLAERYWKDRKAQGTFRPAFASDNCDLDRDLPPVAGRPTPAACQRLDSGRHSASPPPPRSSSCEPSIRGRRALAVGGPLRRRLPPHRPANLTGRTSRMTEARTDRQEYRWKPT